MDNWQSHRLLRDESAVSRASETVAWHRSKGGKTPPPAHWVVNRRGDILGSPHPRINGKNVTWRHIGGGSWKLVYKAILNPTVSIAKLHNDNGPMRAIVKRCIGDYNPRAQWGETLHELIYLELLRGLPGVPLLLGAFYEEAPAAGSHAPPAALHLVLQDSGGVRLGEMMPMAGPNRSRTTSRINKAYTRLARERPIGLTRAMLLCFRSFSELGGFLLRDFTPQQFIVAPRGEGDVSFEMVDGPEPAIGPALHLDEPFLSSGEARGRGGSESALKLPPSHRPSIGGVSSSAAGSTRCARDADCHRSTSYHCCCVQGDTRRSSYYCGKDPTRAATNTDGNSGSSSNNNQSDETPQAAPESQGLCHHDDGRSDGQREGGRRLGRQQAGHHHPHPELSPRTVTRTGRCVPLVDLTHSFDGKRTSAHLYIGNTRATHCSELIVRSICRLQSPAGGGCSHLYTALPMARPRC